MIEELTNMISLPEMENIYKNHAPKDAFSSARCKTKKKKKNNSLLNRKRRRLTDVSHGPIKVISGFRTISILETCCHE